MKNFSHDYFYFFEINAYCGNNKCDIGSPTNASAIMNRNEKAWRPKYQ